MLNSKGEIVIPAQYNDLTNVRGGLVMAIKDAKKKYWHENEPSGCNHFSWVEGKEYLIDTNNKIIIENFKHNYNLDLFSLKIENAPAPEAYRQSFLGADGRYYSFINYGTLNLLAQHLSVYITRFFPVQDFSRSPI